MKIDVIIYTDNTGTNVNFENCSEGDFRTYKNIGSASQQRILGMCQYHGRFYDGNISKLHSYISFEFIRPVQCERIEK